MSVSIRERLGELVAKDAKITDKKGRTILAVVKGFRSSKQWGSLVILDQTNLISGGGTGKQKPFLFPLSKIGKVVPAAQEDRKRFLSTIKMMEEVDKRIGRRVTVNLADIGELDVQLTSRDRGRVFVNLLDVESGRRGQRSRLMLSDIKSISP